MKLNKSVIFTVVLLSMLFLGVGVYFYEIAPLAQSEPIVPTGYTADEGMLAGGGASVDEQVHRILSKMSLQEKIGQMVMIGFYGKDVNKDILYMLGQFHIGGVILFDRNMESVEQVARLTKNLQSHSSEGVPLFIAIDEEGGDVVRMEKALMPPPSQRELGDAGDASAAQEWAEKTAKSLKEMGINVNFAPVADVGSPDMRSYSTDSEVVTDFVRSATQGYVTERMLFCLKHFPGIGRWEVDSHQDISEIKMTAEELEKEYLPPFMAMIREHKPEDYFILVSHLKYPSIDEKYPASLSPAIMEKLLREKMGYKGIIITDDMDMGAIARYYDSSDFGVKAVQAGADIVLICHEYSHGQDAYSGILEAVRSGAISEKRIDASVMRILKAKLTHLRSNDGKADMAKDSLF